ncbi:RES family NAD+ phosphorylase [Cupriavidus malaysiensis]|uniref:RES family NAD+ phosphorylase n=1 Tax=Cupriavidus malaysiensis TaxID=367825 RepID=UPI0012FFA3BE|nr:RES family NAD+ phosphorylase [Cupriavidus malaysiensis]
MSTDGGKVDLKAFVGEADHTLLVAGGVPAWDSAVHAAVERAAPLLVLTTPQFGVQGYVYLCLPQRTRGCCGEMGGLNKVERKWIGMRRKLFEMVEAPVNAKAPYCRECTTDPFVKKLVDERLKGDACMGCGMGDKGTYDAIIVARAAAKEIIPKFFTRQIAGEEESGRLFKIEEVLSEVTGIVNGALCEAMAAEVHCMEVREMLYLPGSHYKKIQTNFDKAEDKRAFVLDRWQRISASILHGQRYYNDSATNFFERLFDEAQSALNHTLFGPKPSATSKRKAGLKLYRARRLESQADIDKISKSAEQELGAPPKRLAAQNRMNARGIPLFYAAEGQATCIAEVRPSIGDTVAVGLFETTRDIKFFDFRKFKHFRQEVKLSYWVEDYQERQICRALLFEISELIAQPVREGETGYITTQAMVEFIRHKLEDDFGGVIFKSVQDEVGVNYVIFSDKEDLAMLHDVNYEPTFPVMLCRKPTFFEINAVSYSSKKL